MDNSTVSDILNKIAVADNNWKNKAEFRQNNKDWLRQSARIAFRVLYVLEQNSKAQKSPATQKELAELLGTSPQQVNKIVKGNENLTLETISRLEKALSVQLIEVVSAINTNVAYYPAALVAEDEVAYNTPIIGADPS